MIANRNAQGKRKCYSCQDYKDDNEFNKSSNTIDGLDYYCKKCKKEKNSKYYQMKSDKWKQEKHIQNRITEKLRTDKIREIVRQIKSAGCKVCGEKTLCCLDFHHTNPTKKDYTISKMVSSRCPEDSILNEISKCIVLCSNCHRKIHTGIIKCPS